MTPVHARSSPMPGGGARVIHSARARPRRCSARASCPGCARRGPGYVAGAGRRDAGRKRTRLRPRTCCRVPAGVIRAVAPSPRANAGKSGVRPDEPPPRPRTIPSGLLSKCRRAPASRVRTCALRSSPPGEFRSRAQAPRARLRPRPHPHAQPATRRAHGRDRTRPRAHPGLGVRTPIPRLVVRA